MLHVLKYMYMQFNQLFGLCLEKAILWLILGAEGTIGL